MTKGMFFETDREEAMDKFFDPEELREILLAFRESGLQHMTLERGSSKLVLEAPADTGSASSSPSVTGPLTSSDSEATVSAGTDDASGMVTDVRAPLLGTFYAASEDNAAPYVVVGDSVRQGDILCIIEAMKMLNYIEAPADGIIKSIKVENADLVEYDQLLMEIIPHNV